MSNCGRKRFRIVFCMPSEQRRCQTQNPPRAYSYGGEACMRDAVAYAPWQQPWWRTQGRPNQAPRRVNAPAWMYQNKQRRNYPFDIGQTTCFRITSTTSLSLTIVLIMFFTKLVLLGTATGTSSDNSVFGKPEEQPFC